MMGNGARGGREAQRKHDHTTYLALATAASMLAVVVRRASRGSVTVCVCVCVCGGERGGGWWAGSMMMKMRRRARPCWSKQDQPKQAA